MPDYKSLIDQLTKDGWTNDDIVTSITNIDKEYNSLLQSQDDPALVADRIAGMSVVSNNKKINVFESTKERPVEFEAPSKLEQLASNIPQIRTPVTTNINPGGIITEQALRGIGEGATKLMPFPGIIRALSGTTKGPKDLNTLVNPIPEIVSEGFHKGIEGINKLTGLNLTKDIEAAMAISPFIPGILPKITDVSRDVTTSAQRLGTKNAPGLPTVNAPAQGVTSTLTLGQTSLKIDPSAKISDVAPVVNSLVIEQAKNLRDISEKLGDVNSVIIANDVINKNGILKPEVIQKNKNFPPDVVSSDFGFRESIADLNILAERIKKNNPSISDIELKQLAEDITSTQRIIGSKIIREEPFAGPTSNLSNERAFDLFDVPRIIPDEVIVGNTLTDLMGNKRGLSSLTDDVTNYIDKPPTNPPKVGQPPPSIPQPFPKDLTIQGNAVIKPMYRVAEKVEVDTGIPTLTELYYKGKNATNKATEFTLTEIENMDKVLGKYNRNTQYNIRARERMSDILEDLAFYNDKNGELIYKDKKGNQVTGTIDSAVKDRNWNKQELEIAAKYRQFYWDAESRGAPTEANFRAYYNPLRYENKPELRQKLFDSFREREKAFFSFYRTGKPSTEPLIKDIKLLHHKYVGEWATVNELMPWYKDIASPILKDILEYKNKNLSTSIPYDFFEQYTRQIMNVPTDGAVKLNYAFNNFIDNWISPRAPKIGEDIKSALGRERIAESFANQFNSLFYKGTLAYRPLPWIRNATQRLFAIPLLPSGLKDLSYGMKELRTDIGKQRFIDSGIGGYLGDMVEKGVAGHKHLSPMRGYQAVENNNRGSIYLSIHDGIRKAFYIDKLSYSEVAKKFHLNLYPEPIVKKFKELYEAGKVGDVSKYGVENNAAHFLGDWAQLMTQFPYEKGGGIRLLNQGPLYKMSGVLGSWSFYTADYMSNLLKNAYKSGPKDLVRVGKMFAYFAALDYLAYNVLDISLASNPIFNIPTRVMESPPITLSKSSYQAITGKWNEIMERILTGRDNEYAKWQSREGSKIFRNTVPTIIPGGKAIQDIDKFINPKINRPKSISP